MFKANHDISEFTGPLISKLSDSLPLPVEYFPERPSAYRLTHPDGVVLISVLARDYDLPGASTGTGSGYRIRFQLTIVSRGLHAGKAAAWPVLESIYKALNGFRIQNRLVLPEREFYIDNQGDIWKYAAIYYLKNIRL